MWGMIVKERGEDAVTPQVADVIFLEIELLMRSKEPDSKRELANSLKLR